MRTTITTIVIVLVCAVGFAIAFNSYDAPITIEINVLRDVTEEMIAQPNATEIFGLYNLSGDNKWNGAEFNFSNVTDVSYNASSVEKIDAANEWLSNEIERNKEIRKFQDSVSEIITNGLKDTIGRNHSSIYLTVAHQLIHLSESKAQKKILVIYSDLMENELNFSFYNQKEFSLLQSNSDSLKKVFEKWQSLPSLNGIEVYLIYQPANAESDAQYKLASDFYRKILEEKGATVHVSANF